MALIDKNTLSLSNELLSMSICDGELQRFQLNELLITDFIFYSQEDLQSVKDNIIESLQKHQKKFFEAISEPVILV